ncbi:MAG: hypothetical protein EOS85_06620 [Mesorhizobium sp.]|nr:MAG: hypothetical protein EOS85_06620 [Mesorhizobium sp.]
MEHYVGIDVSLEESSECTADATGNSCARSRPPASRRHWSAISTNWNCLLVTLDSRPGHYRSGCMPGLWLLDATSFCSRRGT